MTIFTSIFFSFINFHCSILGKDPMAALECIKYLNISAMSDSSAGSTQKAGLHLQARSEM